MNFAVRSELFWIYLSKNIAKDKKKNMLLNCVYKSLCHLLSVVYENSSPYELENALRALTVALLPRQRWRSFRLPLHL